MRKRGVVIIVVFVLICSITFAQNFDVSINMPSSVNAGEEFDVFIDLDIINVSNGMFVAATVPAGLRILSANPDNGFIIGNIVMWTLDSIDTTLSFKAKSEVSGEYNVSVKVGTYYKITDSYKEAGSDKSLTIGAIGDVWSIVDTNNNGIIETSELLVAINRWIAGEIDTPILLQAINLWINLPLDPCAGVICNDNDPCTTDNCVNGNCIYEPIDCGPGLNCMPDPGAPDQPSCMP